ncbi:Prostaglandin E synthase 2 [Seminavis robusta]|uniref:Prostaglandin E synthase 2 n=1 Tax=Seminavis robusta TaxID=568900 RepID=A0A9N8E701_9STRA|nr:Prostaglandin E synthase 2 [Seminavis robusta]|eukprot:Sro580_g170160.1 Prostaglandin E synthase 2 (279) ;mRNA; r:39468-40552
MVLQSALHHLASGPRYTSAAVASTRIRCLSTKGAPEVTLYQYAICPFCNITKSFMSFADLKYKAVEVNPLTKAEISKWSEYKKVPIAMVDGEQVNGSDEIVSKLINHPFIASSLQEKLDATMTTVTFAESEGSKKWEQFARDDLASLLYPNICRTWSDSYEAFSYVKDVESFSSFQKFAIQNVGSLAMYYAASKIKQKRNITDERQALNDALVQLEEEGLGEGKQFLSGKDKPNLGDVAVFGTLRSIEGLPTHDEVMQGREQTALVDWYQRMKPLISY